MGQAGQDRPRLMLQQGEMTFPRDDGKLCVGEMREQEIPVLRRPGVIL